MIDVVRPLKSADDFIAETDGVPYEVILLMALTYRACAEGTAQQKVARNDIEEHFHALIEHYGSPRRALIAMAIGLVRLVEIREEKLH